MLKTWFSITAIITALAGCAAPAPQGGQSVRIEGTPGMAVIYLVRARPDWSNVNASVYIDDRLLGSTHAGTYFRIEVPAGRHRISGFGVDGGNISLDTQAGGIYFVQQRVASSARSPTSLTSSYQVIDETRARAALATAQRAG